MQDLPRAYLRYARASLADSACCRVDLATDVVAMPAGELYAGKLGRQTMVELAELHHLSLDDEDDQRRWPIGVTLFPKVFALLPSHAETTTQRQPKIAPVVLFARLDRTGRLFVNEDGVQLRIPRELLRPTASNVAIGTVEAADQSYATLKRASSVQELLKNAFELLKAVTGEAVEEWIPAGYALDKLALCKVEDPKPAPKHIARLLDLTVEQPTESYPLYESLFDDAARTRPAPMQAGIELLRLSTEHLGQMESRHGLSPSQRESLLHFLSRTRPEVVAVDGPPGTGKTTLLLSVIACQWVASALKGGSAPITVATSTNNQAVLNVLEAFARAGGAEGTLAGRWLPGIDSFGLFLPAQSRADLGNTKDFTVHTLLGKGKQAEHAARAFESVAGFDAAKKHFLQHFGAACPEHTQATLADAVTVLRQKIAEATQLHSAAIEALLALATQLQTTSFSASDVEQRIAVAEREHRELGQTHSEAAEGVQSMLDLLAQWTSHVALEPWWIAALAWLGVTSRRKLRDKAFCIAAERTFSRWIQKRLRDLAERTDIDAAIQSLHGDLERHAAAIQQRLLDAHAALQRIREPRDALRSLLPDTPLTVDAVQAALDVGARFNAFFWTTHFWEAKYLEELEPQVGKPTGLQESKSRDGLEQQYRRLAKLWPCFVSTLFMVPERFLAWKVKNLPLYGAIDLLIVDEAGQVSPELAAIAFTLAQRALVVGDVHQLKPIWGVSAYVDGPNAVRHGVTRDGADLDRFMKSGMAASSGSLMSMAQRATAFAKYPEHGRGLFLSEHRRCLPQIIQICNAMTYGGRLVACRTEGVSKPFPTVGYLHLPGSDRVTGGSRRNEIEARAIVQWLEQNRSDIERTFAADDKPFSKLVTVLTPFYAQSTLILTLLKKTFGKAHGITVGTVYRMQGAECRLIIFSPTYGIRTNWQTRLDKDPSLLNVAISRARDSFLVFGNMNLFRPGSRAPTSHLANALFADEANELHGLDPHLLRPSAELGPGQLIADLQQHRDALAEAFGDARSMLTIVSPFLTSSAIEADKIEQQIKTACAKGVLVRIVTDRNLNHGRQRDFENCVQLLRNAGADVRIAGSKGIHSKLVLVDRSWLMVGSFNWLSAVRQPASRFRRYESSLRYQGEHAFGMIERTLDDLRELAQPPAAGLTSAVKRSPPESP